MKILQLRTYLLILFFVSLSLLQSPINALDDPYVPPEPFYITTSDGIELSLTFYIDEDWGELDIESENFSISIQTGQHDHANFSINNTSSAYNWGIGVLEVTNGHFGEPPGDEVVDASMLPGEYRELWERLQTTCGELLENKEFWDNITDISQDEIDNLRIDMESMRDGYFAPDVQSWLVFCQYFIGYGDDNDVRRGYRLDGPIQISVSTTNLLSEENPEIKVELSGRMTEDRWTIDIDPVLEVCEISWDGGHPEYPDIHEEDWVDVVEEMRLNLEFFNRRVPGWIEGGVIEPDAELGRLLERSLYGLSNYQFEAIYPHRNLDPYTGASELPGGKI